MKHATLGFVFAATLIAVYVLPALASTTGGIRGRVLSATAPVAGATVTATSPSQTAVTVTDAAGTFSFLALAPDSYTLHVEKSGYEPVSQAGAVVFADQTATFVITLVPKLKTIARVRSAKASSLVRSGTTSDVYSVNAAGQKADPLIGVYSAITREDPQGNPRGGWFPHQRLTLDEVLAGYTRNAAYVAFMEDRIGTLESGKLADVVVLDRDLRRSTPQQVLHANVEMTIAGGRVAYEGKDVPDRTAEIPKRPGDACACRRFASSR